MIKTSFKDGLILKLHWTRQSKCVSIIRRLFSIHQSRYVHWYQLSLAVFFWVITDVNSIWLAFPSANFVRADRPIQWYGLPFNIISSVSITWSNYNKGPVKREATTSTTAACVAKSSSDNQIRPSRNLTRDWYKRTWQMCLFSISLLLLLLPAVLKSLITSPMPASVTPRSALAVY